MQKRSGRPHKAVEKSTAGKALRYSADVAGLPSGSLVGFSVGSRGSLGKELRKGRLDAWGGSLPCRRIFSIRWGPSHWNYFRLQFVQTAAPFKVKDNTADLLLFGDITGAD